MTKGHVAARQPMPITVEAGKNYFWCSCGQSKNQPFCDGSHKVEGKFTPVAWKATESGEKWFCACKQTNGQPFCDGSHKALAGTTGRRYWAPVNHRSRSKNPFSLH